MQHYIHLNIFLSSFSGTNNNPTTSRRSDNFRNSTFDNSDDNISPHRKNQKLAAVSLIKLVQEHPVLYDANHVHYRNKKKTEEAWNAIANILGVTGKFLPSQFIVICS